MKQGRRTSQKAKSLARSFCSKARTIFTRFLLLLTVFCILITGVFVKPKKSDAILPALPILYSIGGAVAADVALDMGIKYVAKPAMKKITEKVGKEVAENAKVYDFPSKKVKKSKGKIEVDVSPNDRAKIAKKIADEVDDVIELDEARRKKNASNSKLDVDYASGDPFYKTSVSLDVVPNDEASSSYKAVDFFSSFFDLTLTPLAYKNQVRVTYTNVINGTSKSFDLDGGLYESPKVYKFSPYLYDLSYRLKVYDSSGNISYSDFFVSKKDTTEGKIFEEYLRRLESQRSKTYYADGLVVPEEIKNVYPVDERVTTDFELPNYKNLQRKVVIDIPDDSDTDETVREINIEDLDSDGSKQYKEKIDLDVDVDLEQADVSKNSSVNVNRNYTDLDYEVKKEDAEQQVIVNIENNIKVDDDDTTNSNTGGGQLKEVDEIEVPKNFFKTMQEMGKKVVDMYDGILHFFETSLTMMKKMDDGIEGMVTYFGEFFDWLPREFVVLLQLGFTMGVIAFFLRR